jgi:hypothetical protein
MTRPTSGKNCAAKADASCLLLASSKRPPTARNRNAANTLCMTFVFPQRVASVNIANALFCDPLRAFIWTIEACFFDQKETGSRRFYCFTFETFSGTIQLVRKTI